MLTIQSYVFYYLFLTLLTLVGLQQIGNSTNTVFTKFLISENHRNLMNPHRTREIKITAKSSRKAELIALELATGL